MAEVIRSATSPDDWWEDLPPLPPSDGYSDGLGECALELLAMAVEALVRGTDGLERQVGDATRYLVDHLDADGLLATVALVQDLKRRLGRVEAHLAREYGRAGVLPEAGHLADGRAYEVLRGKDRKAWQHDRWQDDVAAKVSAKVLGQDPLTGHLPDLVNAATGEPVSPFDLIREAQAVHGSTAPRVKALKALDLSADDYCESYPGPWSVKISQPTT